jgi:Ran GTPase-activating protein 1
LTKLDLRNNRIGDDGAAALGGALATSRSLHRLYLSWNRIGDAGAEALALGLRRNAALKEQPALVLP